MFPAVEILTAGPFVGMRDAPEPTAGNPALALYVGNMGRVPGPAGAGLTSRPGFGAMGADALGSGGVRTAQANAMKAEIEAQRAQMEAQMAMQEPQQPAAPAGQPQMSIEMQADPRVDQLAQQVAMIGQAVEQIMMALQPPPPMEPPPPDMGGMMMDQQQPPSEAAFFMPEQQGPM